LCSFEITSNCFDPITTDGHKNYTSYLRENTLLVHYRQQPFNVAWEIIGVIVRITSVGEEQGSLNVTEDGTYNYRRTLNRYNFIANAPEA
jgi:hypothetical protein